MEAAPRREASSLTRRQRLSTAGTELERELPVGEASEEEFILPSEPRKLLIIRAVTLLIIAAVVAVVGAFAWILLRGSEIHRFEQEYDHIVDSLESEISIALRDMTDASAVLANDIILPRGGRGFVYGLQAKGATTLRLCKAVVFGVWAFVPSDEKDLFNAWARENSDNMLNADDLLSIKPKDLAVAKSRFMGGMTNIVGTAGPNGTISYLSFPQATVGSCTGGVPGFADPPYLPAVQAYPWESTAAAFMLDTCTLSDRRDTAVKVAQLGQAGATGLTVTFRDVVDGVVRPTTALCSPVYSAGVADATRMVTGVFCINFRWSEVLGSVVAANGGRTVDLVLHSPARNFQYADIGSPAPLDTSLFTFRLQDGRVTNLGWGDRHATLSLSEKDYSRAFTVRLGFSEFTLTVYPTDEMYGDFQTDLPRQAVIGAVLLITAIASLFVLFDWASKRHTRDLYLRSAIANASFSVIREAMRSRHAFVSMVSHEIRSPASAIVGALDVLATNNPTPFQKEFLDAIRIGSAQILSLVEDALAVGFDGRGQFTLNAVPVDIRRDIVERAWSTIRLERRFQEKIHKIRMELHVAPDVPERGIIDPQRVNQVITNLVGNAIRFVPEGGGVVRMSVRFSHDDDLLVISVEDNGVGLSQEHMAKLFLPFSQAEGERTKQKFGGTGLGLVISRDIARAMGGDLTVESEGLGRGCTFTATVQIGDLAIRRGYNSSSSAPSSSAVPSAGGSVGVRSNNELNLSDSAFAAAPPGLHTFEAPSPGSRRPSSGHPRPSVTLPGSVQVIIESDDDALTGDPFLAPAVPARESFGTDMSAIAHAASGMPAAAPQGSGGRRSRHHRRSSDGQGQAQQKRESGVSALRTASTHTTSNHTSGTLGSGATGSSFASGAGSGALAGGGTGTASTISQAVSQAPSSQSGHRVRIAAAEDDPLVRRVLTMTLALTGMECVGLFPDGLALTDMLERDPNAADCVLLDSNMGGGDRDGLPTIHRLLRLYRSLNQPPPVIVVLSGDGDPTVQRSFLSAGAVKVMLKPASLTELKQLRLFVMQQQRLAGPAC